MKVVTTALQVSRRIDVQNISFGQDSEEVAPLYDIVRVDSFGENFVFLTLFFR